MTAAASVASTNESAEARAPAVVSTSTFASADDAELRMTCEAFAPGSAFALSDTSGGVNNHVRYVDCENGERFVVRLYNNGRETDRVAFEHAVLRAVEPAWRRATWALSCRERSRRRTEAARGTWFCRVEIAGACLNSFLVRCRRRASPTRWERRRRRFRSAWKKPKAKCAPLLR